MMIPILPDGKVQKNIIAQSFFDRKLSEKVPPDSEKKTKKIPKKTLKRGKKHKKTLLFPNFFWILLPIGLL